MLTVGLLVSAVCVAAPRAQAVAGDLDPTFAGDGIDVRDWGNGADDYAASALVETDKVVVAGASFDGVRYRPVVAQYLLDGTLDPAFGDAGVADLPIADDFSFIVGDMVRYPNGNLLVAGRGGAINSGAYRTVVAFLNPAGQSLNLFGTGSYADSTVAALANFDSTGIVVGKPADAPNRGMLQVERFINANLQSNFGSNGRVLVDVGPGDDVGVDAVLDGANKIVVLGRCARPLGGGQTDYDACLLRLLQNGALDTSFSGDGKLVIDAGSTSDTPTAVFVRNGRIVVAGGDFVARVTDAGVLDETFGQGGITHQPSFQGTTAAMASDGSLLMAGRNSTGLATMRVTALGQEDAGYGRPQIPMAYSYDKAHDIGIDSTGRGYLVGTTNTAGTVGSPTDWYAARVKAPGTPPAFTQSDSQTATLTVDGATPPSPEPEPEPGVLRLELQNESVPFGTSAADRQVTASLGEITYRNSLGPGSSWSATFFACSFRSGSNYIFVDDMYLTPGSITNSSLEASERVTPGAPGPLTMDNPDNCYGSAPRTLMNAPPGARGSFVQFGSTVGVDIPAGQPAGTYTSTFLYTLIG